MWTVAGGVLFGYDVGVISGAKVQVAHEMELTCGQEEALVSKPFQSINPPPPSGI
jgi:hypothetical protein